MKMIRTRLTSLKTKWQKQAILEPVKRGKKCLGWDVDDNGGKDKYDDGDQHEWAEEQN